MTSSSKFITFNTYKSVIHINLSAISGTDIHIENKTI